MVAIAEQVDLPRAKAGEVIEAVIETIVLALTEDQEVRLGGFGTFVTSERKAAKGRNPRSGLVIDIPASRSVRFKPAKRLKDAVGPSDPAKGG